MAVISAMPALVAIRDALAAIVVKTKTITMFIDAGVGEVTVVSPSHGFHNQDEVTISLTTNYNGTYTVTNRTDNTFQITAAWVIDDATGTITQTVKTCKIGREQGIANQDYPLIRVDFDRITGAKCGSREIDGIIYCAVALDESYDTLEAVYTGLLDLESKVVDILIALPPNHIAGVRCKYVDTIAFDTRDMLYEIAAVRVKIIG